MVVAPWQAWQRDARPGAGATLRLQKPKFLLGEALRIGVGERSTNHQASPACHTLSWTFFRHNRTARHFGLALACFALASTVMAQEPTPSNHEPVIKVQVQ